MKIEQKFEKFNFLCIINRKSSTRDVHINPRIDHSMDIIIENDIMRANSSSYSLTLTKYGFYTSSSTKIRQNNLKFYSTAPIKSIPQILDTYTVIDFCHFYVSKVRKKSIKLMGNNHYYVPLWAGQNIMAIFTNFFACYKLFLFLLWALAISLKLK